MRYPTINLKKIFRKLKKKYLLKTKGYCHVHGHNWKMQHDGWQARPDAWKRLPNGAEVLTGPMTKKKIYYKCKRCNQLGY